MIPTFIARFFELIFPVHEEVALIRQETPSSFARFYSKQLLSYNSIALAEYHQPFIRAAIHANKFYKSKHAAALLASLLSRWTTQLPEKVVIVPIPLSTKRLRARGYNHVDVIATTAKSAGAVITVTALLKRTRDTPQQSHLSKAARLKNVYGCFSWNTSVAPETLADCHVVLLDDVITTGATMREAAATLQQSLPPSATLTCVAIAH
jgi:ComF family protein